MPSEFEIIRQFFAFSNVEKTENVLLGVGDDAALINLSHPNHLPNNKQLESFVSHSQCVVATDTLVEGVHFPLDMPPEYIASRALGVNLSDFAAMGAVPYWYTLALTLPVANEEWLQKFSQALSAHSRKYGIQLVGGDTTRGPLVISMTVFGLPNNKQQSVNSLGVITRDGAKVGDTLWVSGSLGKGAAALALLEQKKILDIWPLSSSQLDELLQSFYHPKPLLVLGESLLSVATSAIDISDGLLADASHLAEQSKVRLEIETQMLPINSIANSYPNVDLVHQWVLSGGDDYELLFTAPCDADNTIQRIAKETDTPCTAIGRVVSGAGVSLQGAGWAINESLGFTHF